MRSILLVLVLGMTAEAFAQVEYDALRNRFTLNCGWPDSLNLVTNQRFIDSLATVGIATGEEHFLRDRSMLRYQYYLKWKKMEDMERAKDDALVCWEKYTNTSCLWDLGTMYRVLGDCAKALRYTELYIGNVPRELVNYEQVYLRYKFCCGE